MGRALLVGVAAIALAIVACAWRAPASWLGERISAASNGTMKLVAAEGTLWRGRGALASASGHWRIPLAWRVAAAPLLGGTLAVTLEPAAGATRPAGTVRLDTGRVDVDNLALDLPAAALEALLAARVPLTLGGDIVIDAPQAALARDSSKGTFAVRWERASLGLGEHTIALGTVTAMLDARERSFSGPLGNVGGDLRIGGTVELAALGGTLDVTLTPQPSAPPFLAPALAALGTPANHGGVRLRWAGQWR